MTPEEDAYSEWLSYYSGTIAYKSGYTSDDLQAAFEAGVGEGWDEATEYYRNGGTFR